MRNFNKRQKQILFGISGGKCSICKTPLLKSWHADHITPYSKGGQTKIDNGQALCPSCNLKKSNKLNFFIMYEFREWQREAIKRSVNLFEKDGKSSILINACPGSGKTYFAIKLAEKYPDKQIVIISPSEEIKRNWAKKFLEYSGKDIDWKYKFKYDFRNQFNGISITYQSLTHHNNVDFILEHNIIDKNTILIIDEVHHAADDKTWGKALQEIGDNTFMNLLLTGTPYREDNSKIPFVKYEEHKEGHGKYFKLITDYDRSYSDELLPEVGKTHGNLCPVDFKEIPIVHNDSNLGVILDNEEGRKKLRAAYNGGKYTYKMWEVANEKLSELREFSNAAGLIICNNISAAKELQEKIPTAKIVTSRESLESAKTIERFKRSDSPDDWIIAVNMIAEGVDIDRIRVILYATMTRTKLYFTQVLGRGIRNCNSNEDYCHVYIPQFRPLMDFAEEVKEDMKHYFEIMKSKRTGSGGGGGLGENEYDGDDFTTGSDDTNINNGFRFTPDINENEITPLAMQFGASEELVRSIYAAAKGSTSNKENRKTKTEQIQDTKNRIHRKVKKIAYLDRSNIEANMPYTFDNIYGFIHASLNKQIGVKSTANCVDLDMLFRKLKKSEQWIESLMVKS